LDSSFGEKVILVSIGDKFTCALTEFGAIACWGSFGSFQERSTKVAADLIKLHCLAINNDEEPTHPLYLRANLKPIPYAKTQSI